MDPTRTDVTVCSEALTLIGQKPIQSFTEQTEKAGVCKRTYGRMKRSVMSLHPWKFTFKKVQLSLLVEPPLTQWSYQFNLPGDRLQNFPYRVFETDDVDALEFRNFEIFGDKLLANVDTLWLDYQYDTPESKWEEPFVDFFVTALAAKLAYPLAKDIRLAQKLEVDAYGNDDNKEGGLLQKAKTQNSINHPVRSYGDNTLASARFGGSSTISGGERFQF